ncbi:MAG: hypothetical protein ACWGN1_02880 [Desulfobulbales bacterium]
MREVLFFPFCFQPDAAGNKSSFSLQSDQWHELQLELEQPEHPDPLVDPPADEESPPRRCAKTDICFCRSSLWHLGHLGLLLPMTKISNFSPQERQIKSNKGIILLPNKELSCTPGRTQQCSYCRFNGSLTITQYKPATGYRQVLAVNDLALNVGIKTGLHLPGSTRLHFYYVDISLSYFFLFRCRR